MRRFRFTSLAAILLMPLLSGCLLITGNMWSDALKKPVAPSIVGVVDAMPEGSSRHLLISYRVSQEAKVFTLIPIRADSAAAYPLAYEGKERKLFEILHDCSATQKQTILDARFRRLDQHEAKRLMASPRFHPIDTPAAGVWQIWAGFASFDQLTCLAYSTHPVAEKKNEERWDPQLNADTHILFLPHNQPRPILEHTCALTGATVLTPITVVADIVLTPAYAAILMSWGYNLKPVPIPTSHPHHPPRLRQSPASIALTYPPAESATPRPFAADAAFAPHAAIGRPADASRDS